MEMQKQVIMADLERAREDWLPHYKVAKRAGFMSAEANLSAEYAFQPIDELLDELGGLALKQTVESQS